MTSPTQPSSDSMDSDEETVLSPPISPCKPIKMRTRTISQSQLGRTSSTKITAEPIVRYGDRTIYTHGRPPWYDAKGEISEPFLIGICGGSASGKTTVAKSIIEALDVPWVSLVSLDSFYKVLSSDEKLLAAENNYNFDHPNAFDFDSVAECLMRLKQGKSVHIPIYDFTTHSRLDKTKIIYGANVIIFEGILAFTKILLDLMDLKVFVDTDSDERLVRRLRRDISERGRDLHGVLDQCTRFVKPAYEQFIAPSMTEADIIIPRGGQNHVAIDLIVQHVNKQLKQRGHSIRQQLVSDEAFVNQKYPNTLHVLPDSKQVIGLHTLVRSSDIHRDAFVFYSDRLMRLLCEFAMSLLPYKDIVIDTPQGTQYKGKRLAVDKLIAVSILRAGETLEPALCAVAKDVCLSKILIQTNPVTQEPELHYLRLPKDIANCHVMLLDSTVATGAAAIMAIRVLLEHDVAEENITLMSLLMASQGVHSVAYSYPKVKIVTTAVDKKLNENYHIIPGLGNFGDRYFGTGPVETDHNTTQD